MKRKKVFILLLGLVIGGGFAIWDHGIRVWERAAPEGALLKDLVIAPGTPAKTVGDLLIEGGWLRSQLEWRLFCSFNRCDGIKAGRYQFRDREGLKKVVEIISKGEVVTRKVTIPEGEASWEIFSRLKRSYSNLDSIKWESLVHDSLFAKELGVNAKSLEGYLLPETYQLPWECSEEKLLRILVSSFHKAWNSLDTAHSPVFKLHGKEGVVTLASIVEEETAQPAERGRIAGVFWNRLQRGISLGADPTVRFIFRSLDGPIFQSQLDSNSPYNTRKFRGLPPGPISNPGKESLRAALHPEATKELYFVAKDDGSREHFFSKTLAEHNRYKEIAAQNRSKAASPKR